MAIQKKLASQHYAESVAKSAIYDTENELTDVQKSQARENIGIPAVTTDDAGKFLRVSSEGQYVVEALPNAEDGEF